MYSFGIKYVRNRYSPEHLLVSITPGPKELTCDELQYLLEIAVDDKIRLYREVITVQTTKYPTSE